MTAHCLMSSNFHLPCLQACLQACSLHLRSHANFWLPAGRGAVELTPQANALVGKPGLTGLSVEARKRLTIAVELVSWLRRVCCARFAARCRCGLCCGSGRQWPQLCLAVKRVSQLAQPAPAASDSHVPSLPGLKAPAPSSVWRLPAVSVWHDLGSVLRHSLVCAVFQTSQAPPCQCQVPKCSLAPCSLLLASPFEECSSICMLSFLHPGCWCGLGLALGT